MKASNNRSNRILTLLSYRFRSYILSLILLTAFTFGYSQVNNPIADEIKDAIKTYASYTANGPDRITSDLKGIGFDVPENLKSTWKDFTPIRKIETAYWAAGSNENGKKMLAVLFQNLARRYKSIESEPTALYLKEVSVKSNTMIKFGKITSLELPELKKLDQGVKETILTLSKYGEAKALGGARGILKFYFNITDEMVYDILRSSQNNLEALLTGISIADIPPSQRQRLKSVIEDLQKCYESARSNIAFKAIVEMPPAERMPNGQAISRKELYKRNYFLYEFLDNGTSSWIPLLEVVSKPYLSEEYIYEKYNKYLDDRNIPSSKLFDRMSSERYKWGGIVFGNKVTTDKNTIPNKLLSVAWFPYEDSSIAPSGTLEFRFEHESNPRIIAGVKLEDVYAAFEMLFEQNKKLPPIGVGEGLGLVSSERIYEASYDSIKEKRNLRHLIVHPSIANFELGRALARSDVFPRTQTHIIEKILKKINLDKSQLDAFNKWIQFSSDSNGFKFTDAPLLVQSKNSFLTLKRLDVDSAIDNSYLNFLYTSPRDSVYKRFEDFYLIVPVLASSFFDYERLNSFSKIIAILRWAKEQNAVFLNKPLFPKILKVPELLNIDRKNGFVEIIDIN